MTKYANQTHELIAKLKKLSTYAIDFNQGADGYSYFRIPSDQEAAFKADVLSVMDVITTIENTYESN